ncbi:TAXI family TRAP transporter solute-binding subunit [Microbaculum marinum]|uniref:TAXI family TRAP transporter solute-binding subunit n=1 Tax=Microbaculum marinum TaxID=1764581 RepID=A0AAW9RZW5_9HYPH
MENGRRHLVAGILVAGTAALFAQTASAQQIKLMTGPQGGSWYPLGGAIQNIVESNVDGVSVQVLPGAGIANVKGIEGGKADMGFANSVSTVDAINGKPPFDGPAKDTCNVATLYPQYFQVVALADAGIETPADVKGKAASIQPRGNTAEAISAHMLEAYGMTYDDLSKVNFGSYTDAVSLMKDGNAQVFTLGTTVPAGAIMDLASARDIKMVPIPDDGLAKMQALNAGYKRGTIKAGSYPGVDEDVPTIVYATHIIARCSLDEDVVYNVTKNLAENIGDLSSIAKAMSGLTASDMAADVGVPLHPGAEKYFKEQGAL